MERTFDPNSDFMYLLTAIVVAFVIAQSIVFLLIAVKRAKKLGIDKKVISRTISSSAVFTIAPAIAILVGVISLSQSLGFPFPWLRLSVIGAVTYELPAAEAAASAAGVELGQKLVTDPKVFTAITWVMTLGIFASTLLVPILGKRIENGVVKLRSKDKKWGDIFMDCMFLGMISAFLGYMFADVREGLMGFEKIIVMIASAALMAVMGLLIKKCKWQWLENYAMPIAMLGSMGLAIPIDALLRSIAA